MYKTLDTYAVVEVGKEGLLHVQRKSKCTEIRMRRKRCKSVLTQRVQQSPQK